MHTNAYALRGRRLLIEFRCGRCGKTHIEPYSVQAAHAEGNLQCFQPPEGWLNDGLHNPMLCESCHRQFKAFMSNERFEEEVDSHD